MKRFLPIVLLGLLLLNLIPAGAQTLQPDYGAPTSPVNVCDGNAVFKVRIVGGSAACAQGSLNISLPAGYLYAPATAALSSGSGSVSETSVSGNTATLNIQSIPAAPGVTEISFQAYATCAALSAGTAVNNQVNYSFNSSCAAATTVTSNSFNTQSASLIISNITNTSYFGAAGDNYTRTITITNNGWGSISRVNLTDTSGSGLSIKGISASGGWTFTTSKLTVGADTVTTFTLLGGTLSQGQSITLIENVTMVSNCNLQTRFATWFGCDNVPCSANNVSGTATAGATVNNSYLPSLKVIPDLQALLCRGTDYQQTLRLTNTGSVKLNDLKLNLFSTATTQPASLQTFDAGAPVSSQSAFGNFQYKVGLNGAWSSLGASASSSFSAPASCIGSFNGSLSFHIPVINPGDTLYIRYTEKNCAVTAAVNGPLVTAGTLIRYDYEAPCGGRTTAVSSLLRTPLVTGIVPQASLPASMVPGQSYNFNYRFPVSSTALYTNTGANASTVRFALQLPANIVFSGNASAVHLKHAVTGAILASPTSFAYNSGTHTINLSYNITAGFTIASLQNAILGFDDMTLDCGIPSSGNTVTLNAYLRTSPACATEEWLFSQPTAISFACPQPPCNVRGGMEFSGFSLQRTNFGFADNDNNGTADPSGTLDLSKIRSDLAMPGDTVVAIFNGRIVGGSSSPSFQYAYAVDTFTKGASLLSNLYARVEIYLFGSSTPYYICPNVPIQGTGSTRKVDASLSSLNSILPVPGYAEYLDGDSVVVYTYYKVTGNPGSTFADVEAKNAFYLSDIADPAASADRYTCGNDLQGSFSIVGYEAGTTGTQTYTSVGNGNIATAMDHFLSIGGAAAGGKPFINEYRPVSIHDQVQYTVPANFEYVSATVTYNYTTGPGVTTSKTVAISPVNATATPLVFNVANLFSNGTFPAGDQGNSLTLTVTIKPGCEAPASSQALFNMSQIQTPGFNTGFPGSSFNGKDSIYLIIPEIIASTANTTPTSNDATVSWEIQISNPTIATASRVWMAKAAGAGVTITSIQRLSGPGGFVLSTLTPGGGGIYQLGSLTQSSNYYRITATYTSCVKDNMKLAYWYDCAGVGYPANVASAVFKKEIDLFVIPLQPALQTSVVSEPTGAAHDFCDVLTYELETINTGSSAVSGLTVTVALPAAGTAYVPGTFQLQYPAGSGSYITIGDAQVNAGSSTIIFTIPNSEVSQLFSTEGFRIRFGLTTACAFGSGGSFRFYSTGSSFCGTITNSTQQQSQKILINGIPQYTNIYSVSSVTTTGLLDCATGDIVANYKFKIINQGPLPTTIADGFRISLPSPWELNTSSISFTHDPAGASYTGLSGGNYNFLTGAGVPAGDSVVFTATVRIPAAAAASYPTGTSAAATEQAVIRYGGVCSQTGVACPVTEVVVATQNTTTFTYNGGQTGLPVIQVNNPAPVCAPATVDITQAGVTAGSTPGLTYTYFTDAAGTNALANPSAVSASGTYYIKGTSAGGCFAVKPVVVAINPQPLAAISYAGSPFCGGTAGAVTQTGQTGGTYNSTTGLSINPVTGEINPAASTPGTYVVTYTFSNGTCSNTAATTVVVGVLPVASISYPNSPYCASGAGSNMAIVNQTGQAGGSYSSTAGLSIDPATGTVDVGASTPGTYTVTYTAGNGTCTTTATASIVIGAAMNLAITDPAPVCAPNTVDLTAATITAGSSSGLTFQYFTDAAGTTALANPSAISTSGTYYIQGTTPAGCRTSIHPVKVVINPLPVAAISYAGSPFCGAGTASVTQTGQTGGSYSAGGGLAINPSTGEINLSSAAPGTYTITYTFSNGSCTNTATASITVSVPPVMLLNNPAAVCAPATVDLTAPAVTAGSTPGLTYAYYTDAAVTIAVTDPAAVPAGGIYYIKGTNAAGCSVIMPVQVTINPIPVATIAYPGSPFCTAGTANVTQTGQAGGTYSSTSGLSIDPVTGAINITTSTTGSYIVTYNFTNGTCGSSVTTTVVIAPIPLLTVTNPAAVCAPLVIDLTGGSVTAGSTPGLTFNYYADAAGTTALTNPNAVSVSGTYYIQGITPAGCRTAIRPVIVTINPQPVATITYNGSPYCAAQTAIANVTQTGQTGGIYGSTAGLVLSSTTGAIDLTASTPGTYTVTYTFSNGICSSTTTAAVTINPLPILIITNPAAVCSPGTVDITAPTVTAGSTPGLSYTYFVDPNGLIKLSAPNAIGTSGTYYVQGTAPTGCVTGIEAVVVTVNLTPTATIVYNSAPFCLSAGGTGNVTQTGISSGTYTSLPAGLSLNSSTGAIDIASSIPGAYTVTYSFSNGLCGNIATTTVNILPKPVLNITDPAPACLPASVDLTAAAVTAGSTAGLTFEYFTDAAGTTPLTAPSAITTSGTYYIRGVYPASGCVSDIKPVNVTVSASPVITVGAGALVCKGEAVTLTASSPGNTISWQNIGTGNSVIVHPQANTTYSAVATNAAGCTATGTVLVQVRDFDVTLTANTNPIMPGMMLTLTSGANSSYTVVGWKPDDQFSAQTAIAQSFIIKDSAQTFAVIGRSADGCLDTATIYIELEPGGKDFFIPNAFTPNNDGKNDSFKPYGSSIKSIELRVFNQWGELVYETKDKNKGWDGMFKGKAQPVGVYPYGIKVTFLDNTTTTRRGTVNLVR
jgi:gliding motility-associated-like protein